MNNNVNNWMVQNYGTESEVGFKQGDDLDLCNQTVEVNIRNFARRLSAVDRKVADIDLQSEWNGVETAEVNSPSRDSLQLRHHATPDQPLKRIGGRIPRDACQQEDDAGGNGQQILPPSSPTPLSVGFGHCNDPLGSNGSVRISLPERRFCSHATKSSFIFCCVRTSLI